MSDEVLTTIANRALDMLGKGPTGNIATPTSPLEKRLAARLPDAILTMLRIHRWPAARKSAQLPGSTITGDRYRVMVQLPSDCAMVWRVGADDAQWHDRWERRQGAGAGAIVTNLEPPVTVVYGRLLEPAEMTEEMRAVAAALAADMVKNLAALSGARREELRREVRDAIVHAARVAGSEDGPDTPFGSPWLDAMGGL